MSKRNRREHGRIISVETKTRGDALAEDVAAGVTSITVEDAGDFDEDGGWLLIGGQVVEFTECDDDTGVITLVDPLDAAAEQGDPVQVWSELYEEVVDYQLALVELDGEYDNPDPVVAEVSEGVGSLPEGDRGKAGESCTLHRVAADEWEVTGVGGRARKAKGYRFYDQDRLTLQGEDIGESVTAQLTYKPEPGSVHVRGGGLAQEVTEYTVDYDAGTVTIPVPSWVEAGDQVSFLYAYKAGIITASLAEVVILPFQSTGWKYKQIGRTDATDYSASGYDDSAWATGAAAFGHEDTGLPAGWPSPSTEWAILTRIWLRRTLPATAGRDLVVNLRLERYVDIYLNGTLVVTEEGNPGSVGPLVIPGSNVLASNVLAIRATDDTVSGGQSYIDIEVRQ